ncbi:hypothetical protein MSPP1_000335 [Malassezia sp. CBS 17886]|nr:hypothetical protein MSPP1_000335 [Malassezia sp. CBS 17886]
MWSPATAQGHAYWDMHAQLPADRLAAAAPASPSRYMVFRADAEHAQMLVPQHASGAPFYPAAPAASQPMQPMYPYAPSMVAVPMHPDLAQHLQRLSAGGSFPGGSGFSDYAMADQQQQAQLPMLMPMPAGYGVVPHDKGAVPALDDDRPDALLDIPWSRTRGETMTPAPDMDAAQNMDELMALSRRAQQEAGGNPNLFVCPHCEKRYAGKHARSIWRRHLQDKHAIPLSVQPRRTRWDRDANRPRNATERRERMLESKRRWARKRREQERQANTALRESEGPCAAEPAVEPAVRAPLPKIVPASPVRVPDKENAIDPSLTEKHLLPTPSRTAFAPRDPNLRLSARKRYGAPSDLLAPAKSPGAVEAKMFLPSPFPLLQSTPMRQGWRAPAHSPPDTASMWDAKRRGPPASLTKRSTSDRAALASFARAEPSPRTKPGSASKRAGKSVYGDMQDSPTARALRTSAGDAGRGAPGGDQFSSPQHLNLTQSLGLAPHSANKPGGAFAYPPGVSMTPVGMGIGATPFGKMPLGFTPTIGGLLRGGLDGSTAPPSAGSSAAYLAGAGDASVSQYMMGCGALETPSAEIVRSARRGQSEGAFHSSSERDEDDDLDQEGECQRNGSPSVRPRLRGPSLKPVLPTHDSPSKMRPTMRPPSIPTPLSRRPRTPHSLIR